MGCIAFAALLALLGSPAGAAARYVKLPAGTFTSALAAPDGGPLRVRVTSFWMRVEPVTNGEFLAFVRMHSRWQRHIPIRPKSAAVLPPRRRKRARRTNSPA